MPDPLKTNWKVGDQFTPGDANTHAAAINYALNEADAAQLVAAELKDDLSGAVTADIESRAPQVIADPDNPSTHVRIKIGDAVGPPTPGTATTWPMVNDKPLSLAAGATAQEAQEAIDLPETYTKLDVDEDLTPTVRTSLTAVRVLTPENANTKFTPLEEALFIPGKAFDPSTGNANYASINSGQLWGWFLDPSANESLMAQFAVPEHWTTITGVTVYWVPTTADSGNVVWQVNVFNLSHNNSLSSGGGLSVTSGTSPGSGTNAFRRRDQPIVTSFAVDPLKTQKLYLNRLAADSLDTYIGDIAVIGAKISGA